MKSISLGLLVLSLTVSLSAFTQTEYCLPIEKARLLVADAMAKRELDSMVVELSGKVELLETDKITTAKNFNDLLAIERDQVRIQKDIARQHRGITETYQDETKRLKKKVRARTWQRNGLGVIALALLVLSVTN